MKATPEMEVGEERRLRQRSSRVSYIEPSKASDSTLTKKVAVVATRRGRDSRGKPTILKIINRRSKQNFKSKATKKNVKPKSKGGGGGGGGNWANLLYKSKQCLFCGKLSATSRYLEDHYRTHTGEQPFKCRKCDKTFTSQGILWGHTKNAHRRPDDQGYACSYCGKFFSSTGSRWVHQKLHEGVLKYKCAFCPRKFLTPGHKYDHQKKCGKINAGGKKVQRSAISVNRKNFYYNKFLKYQQPARLQERQDPIKRSIKRSISKNVTVTVWKGTGRKNGTKSVRRSSRVKIESLPSADTELVTVPKVGRGRPKKSKSTAASNLEASNCSQLEDNFSPVKEEADAEADLLDLPPPVKLGRGRPRKSTTATSTPTPSTSNQAKVAKVDTTRRRSSRVREPQPLINQDPPTIVKKVAAVTVGRRQRTRLAPKHSTCDICWKVCPNPRALTRHMSRMHHDDDDLQYHCDRDNCDKSYTEHWQLRRHIQMSHTAVPGGHKCSIKRCTGVFANAFLLHAHQRKVHGLNDNVRFRCNHCNKGFDAIMHLIAHKRMCHAKLSSHSFTSHGSFEENVSGPESDNVKSYRCAYCFETFNTKKRLQLHLSVEHPGKVPSGKKVSSKLRGLDASSIVCVFCGNVFKNKYIFEYHFNMHTKELPYVCTGCGKGFYAPGTLSNHQKRCLDESDETDASKSEDEEGEEEGDLTYEEAKMLEVRLTFLFFHALKLYKRARRRRTGLLERYQMRLRRRCWESRRLRERQIFGCPICPEMFSMRTHRNTHIAQSHPSEEPGQPRKAFEAPECCSLSFVTETELFRHKCEIQLMEEEQHQEPLFGSLKLTRGDLNFLKNMGIVKEGEID